jgi:hypothetical protein
MKWNEMCAHTHGADPPDQGEIQIVTILKANTGDMLHVCL